MIRIHDKEFKTKREAENHIRQIRDNVNQCTPIEGEDFKFLKALVGMHHSAGQKIGCGIAVIYTMRNPDYPSTVNFWIQRTDGSKTDFSFKECLSPTSHRKRFYNACRVSVEQDIMRFKKQFFANMSDGKSKCPITGEEITVFNSHVDHAYPAEFQTLVDAFIRSKKIRVESVEILGNKIDNVCQDTFADNGLRDEWQTFHNWNAKLRIVSKKANLSILRKQT